MPPTIKNLGIPRFKNEITMKNTTTQNYKDLLTTIFNESRAILPYEATYLLTQLKDNQIDDIGLIIWRYNDKSLISYHEYNQAMKR
tara:strand:+ start:321 stop:578 length:258 start_codon:yes stop_codon:yes gene_type:complete